MSLEFTGERVVPGQVDTNLWNEHVARYQFAKLFAADATVLDAGCGTGYGVNELANEANFAVGVDIAADALQYAALHCANSNLQWLQASCTSLPLLDKSFDLVVAFEVIEHLQDWSGLLREAQRVIKPNGVFLVSTPNKSFYTESRADSGPNPFHEHEFTLAEFRNELQAIFPHVEMFLEDHTEGVSLRADQGQQSSAHATMQPVLGKAEEANFFLALCSLTPRTLSQSFVYIPRSANLLKERGLHIERLQSELKLKNDWLADSRREHQELMKLFRTQTAALEQSNLWAQGLNADLTERGQRVVQLQSELEELQQAFQSNSAEWEQWAAETLQRLEHQTAELGRCVALLQQAESTLEERTLWALDLDRQREELSALLAAVEASRWVRTGRLLGVGPQLRKS